MIIQDEIIAELPSVKIVPYSAADKVVDAKGGYVIPGVINNHTHGVAFGLPWYATSRERVLYNLNRHLLQGETTLLSVDGSMTIWEVEATNKIHPINIKPATLHMPLHIKQLESRGLVWDKHLKMSAAEMIRLGAVAIGEAGLYTDPCPVPAKVLEKTGRYIDFSEAKLLWEAMFGQTGHITPSAFDPERMRSVLEQLGLSDEMTLNDVRDLKNTLVQDYELSKNMVREAAEYALKLNTPVIMHHGPEGTEQVQKVAPQLRSLLIAAHCNHLFEVEEAIENARKLKKHGAIVDIYGGDSFGRKQMRPSPEVTFRLLEEGLVDTICTDYIFGYWDPILLVLEKAVEEGVIDLPRAIALATSNVAKAIPKIAPNRGLIAPGKIADLLVVNKDKISEVDTVIIGGRIVVEGGKLVSSIASA